MTNQPTTPLTDQQLDDIEARAQAATDGPWEASPHQHHADGCRCLSCYDDPTGWQLDHPNALDCEELVAQTVNDFGRARASCDAGPLLSYQDANFAAHARQDVPALVTEVRRLRARQLTASEYNAAWHAVEGAAGQEGADPGTVLHAVLDRLGIEWQTAAHPAAARTSAAEEA